MINETLQQRVNTQLGENVTIPSKVKSDLAYCSKKLEHVQTLEEFDAILDQYRLLGARLKSLGLRQDDFKKIISDMKKEL